MTMELFETNMFQDDSASFEQPSTVIFPEWFKKVAEWWHLNKISDSEFLNNLKYLTEKQIISLPGEITFEHRLSDGIPYWFKEDAGKWYTGLISDSEFTASILKITKIN